MLHNKSLSRSQILGPELESRFRSPKFSNPGVRVPQKKQGLRVLGDSCF